MMPYSYHTDFRDWQAFVFQGAACLGVVIFFFLFFSFRIPSWYDEVGEFCIYPVTLGQAGRRVPWVLWSYTREMC